MIVEEEIDAENVLEGVISYCNPVIKRRLSGPFAPYFIILAKNMCDIYGDILQISKCERWSRNFVADD